MSKPTRYTREVLEAVVAPSKSISEAMRRLGCGRSGGMHNYITAVVRRYGIDTSHFDKSWARGQSVSAAKARKNSGDVLRKHGGRLPAYQIRRAMLETGIPERCSGCGLVPEWEGKPLRLEIDHVNGDGSDDTPSNIRFMCPNCHSQTDNFRRYKSGNWLAGVNRHSTRVD